MSTAFFARFLVLYVVVAAVQTLGAQTTSQDDFRTAVVTFFEKNSKATVGATVGFLKDHYCRADVTALQQQIGGVRYYRIVVDSNRILELRPDPMALYCDSMHREDLDSCAVVDVTVLYRQAGYHGTKSFSIYCPLLPRFESMKDSVSVSLLELSKMLDNEQNGACRLQDYLDLLGGPGWRVKKVGYSEPDLYINGVRVVYENGISVAFAARSIEDVKRGRHSDVVKNNKDMFVQYVSFIMPNEIGYPIEFFVYRSSCGE